MYFKIIKRILEFSKKWKKIEKIEKNGKSYGSSSE